MQTFQSFAAAQGAKGEIKFYNGEKRAWCTVGDKRVLVKPETDVKEPLYVTRITEDSQGNPIEDEVYVMFNIKSEVAFTLTV